MFLKFFSAILSLLFRVLTSNDSVIFGGTSDNHDGVVERALSFLHKLFGTTTNDDRARFCLGTPGEEVEPETRIILLIPYS